MINIILALSKTLSVRELSEFNNTQTNIVIRDRNGLERSVLYYTEVAQTVN